ncbi:MAG: AEC family transporter, partial [Oscillospiraceae bacterium]|nr:AEC family transporter [Oscillospiraceae bacterium]
MAIAEFMYGSGNTGPVSYLVAIVVPITNVLAVTLFETMAGNKLSPGKLVLHILQNPFIIGTTLGLVFHFIPVQVIPNFLDTTIQKIAALATPLVLISMGAQFSFDRLEEDKGMLTWIVVIRLIVIPAIFLPLGILIGFREKDLFALILLAASPTAVASYLMASQMGGNARLASQAVVMTTMLSMLTMIGWIAVINMLGYL